MSQCKKVLKILTRAVSRQLVEQKELQELRYLRSFERNNHDRYM